jgi:hypothetical protein
MTEVDEYEARRAKVADQVKLLLAKAAGTDNEHERETFEAAAAKKMRRWMIDETELRGAMGHTGASDILEEIFDVAWEDGCGMERGLLAGSVARPYGVECVVLGQRSYVDQFSDPTYYQNVRASLIGTRVALDAVLGLLPEQLVQCDAASVRAWDERLAARDRLHEERSMDQYGYLRPPSGHAQDFLTSIWSVSSPWPQYSAGVPKKEAGLCNCGCGTPVDEPRNDYRQPYTYGSSNGDYRTYDEIMNRLMSTPPQPAKGSAAGRLALERKRFMKSFINGWAQRVEERLKKASATAETPEEQNEADRVALVLKADADRAIEEAQVRYPNATSTAYTEQDMAARSAGWDNAAGADLGGARFDGNGGMRGIGA